MRPWCTTFAEFLTDGASPAYEMRFCGLLNLSISPTMEDITSAEKFPIPGIDFSGGTEDELNCEMNVVAGLVNLHLMKTLHRGSPKLRRRFLG